MYLGLPNLGVNGGNSPFGPASLFAGGAPGVWFDPSDFTSLYQDAAGTTPVTAFEQPVGLMLDKSGRGNHASQATTTQRPVVSARVNSLVNSVNLAGWGIISGVTNAQNAADPFGVPNSAWTINNTAGAGDNRTQVNTPVPVDTATYIGSVYIQKTLTTPANLPALRLQCFGGTTVNSTTVIDPHTGAGISTAANGDWGVVDAGAYWRVWARITNNGTAGSNTFVVCLYPGWRGDLSSTAESNVAGANVFFGPQFELATNLGVSPYQWITSATTYNSAGFPAYLKFDGVDDGLATGNISLSSTSQAVLIAGATKLSATTFQSLAQFGTVAGAGSFLTEMPYTAGTYHLDVRGASAEAFVVTAANFGEPNSAVFTGQMDLTAATVVAAATVRINGVAQTPGSSGGAVPGGGPFGSYALYLGKGTAGSNAINGRLYGLILAGAAQPANTITFTERWMGQKMGIAL